MLWEYGTHEVQRLLNKIADERSLTTTTLKPIKALLSGVFRMSIVGKQRSGPNPVHEAMLPTYSAREPGDTVAYDLSVIQAVLPLLPLLAPKSKASRSTVPVIPQLRVMLDRYRAEASHEATELLFPSRLETLRRLLRRTFREVGSRWVGWHGCRRGLATNLFARGVEHATVQKILRHSSLSVTMTHYVKVADETKANAMQMFSESMPERERNADAS